MPQLGSRLVSWPRSPHDKSGDELLGQNTRIQARNGGAVLHLLETRVTVIRKVLFDEMSAISELSARDHAHVEVFFRFPGEDST